MDANSKVDSIGQYLCDTTKPMKGRFRALFTLRHVGGQKAIDWILKSLLEDKSALLKHECAYVLG